MDETIIMFKEENEEAVNYKTGDIILKDDVISEIRNKKQNDEIVKFEIKELVRNKEFVIEYKDGKTYKIDINKKDYYAVSLETMLKSKKKIYDEVTYTITGGHLENQIGDIKTFSPWKAIGTVQNNEEKIVKSPIEIINYVKCLYQNEEISSFDKKGDGTLDYIIITTEDEKIRIITDAANNAVPLLDDIYLAYKEQKKKENNEKNKKILKTFAKVAIVVGTITLISQNPYVEKTTKLITTKVTEWNQKEAEKSNVQDNLLVMSSYYSHLKTQTLSKDEYDHFVSLINETMAYYEKYNKTDSIDYELLLDYEQLADSKYEEISKRY